MPPILSDYKIIEIFNSIGAIAIFLFGMKIMGDGIQRVTSHRIRKFLNVITQGKISTIVTGMGTTAAMQSSSAVGMLIISFVNTGLLSLYKAFALMIGANIGTTFKLWLISLGYRIDIQVFSFPLIAIAIPFYFSKNQKMQAWATSVIGFSLMFIGLSFLTKNLSPLLLDFNLLSYIQNYYQPTLINELIVLFSGILLTLLTQSSSASTSIIVVLHSLGFPLTHCAIMILGANIGTTSTTLISSFVANTSAKFVAYFHSLFNLTGAFIFFFFTNRIITLLTNHLSPNDYFIILALFHTIFNVTTALLFLPLIGWLSSFSEKYIHKKTKGKNLYLREDLSLLNPSFSIAYEMYIYEANKKLLSLVGSIKQSITLVGRLITESDEEKFLEFHFRLLNLENQGDKLEKEIIGYLNSISNMDLQSHHAKRINHLMEVSKELENVGDLLARISFIHKKRRETNSFITPKLRTQLLHIQDLISTSTTHLIQNINDDALVQMEKPSALKREIKLCYIEAYKNLFKTLEKEKIKPISALLYLELIKNYETIGARIYKANNALMK